MQVYFIFYILIYFGTNIKWWFLSELNYKYFSQQHVLSITYSKFLSKEEFIPSADFFIYFYIQHLWVLFYSHTFQNHSYLFLIYRNMYKQKRVKRYLKGSEMSCLQLKSEKD